MSQTGLRRVMAYDEGVDKDSPLEGFPIAVQRATECPWCGRQPLEAKNGQVKVFCRDMHRMKWHQWRRQLAAARIAEAARVIEAELVVLKRG